MKKVLIVTDAWKPQVNGVVTVIEKVIEELKRKGFEVSLIEPSAFKSVPVLFYPEVRLSLFPKRRVRKMIEDIQPDYIHIATEGPLGYAVRNVCLKKGYSFTTSYHTHFPEYLRVRLMFLPAFMSKLSYIYMWHFHSKSRHMMVATKSLENELKKYLFRNMVIWPLGVDTGLFTYNPNSPVSQFTKPVFAYLGRIALEKNVEEYLQLPLNGTKLVIGDGPARKDLEKKYSTSVQFVGYKKGKELVDWLSRVDVLIFPSRTDTFGLVIIEAMACGVPVAAHDAMGPRDVIENGVDGVLTEDLKEGAEQCLSLSKEACRKKALEYSWSASVDTFVKNLVSVR